ncbi:hypothetical protein BU15DRAFT_52578 [Melanogaster broomeanus]|nr:hypothetical protein BU15DRAFT_52578 [Melanogaster broomeanus]
MFFRLVVYRAPLVLLGIFSGLRTTLAQSSNATCSASYSWAMNSLRQSPCLVAAYLESQCINSLFQRVCIVIHNRTYIQGPTEIEVPAHPNGQPYIAPSGTRANRCECNTVVYSLVSACGACQGANHLSWQGWIINCNVTADRQVVFPGATPMGTAIPPWAKMTVKCEWRLHIMLHKSYLIIFYSKAVPGTRLQPVSTLVTSPSSTTTSKSSHSGINVGAIAGGVVGGVIGLLAMAGTILYCIRRKRGTNRHSSGMVVETPEANMTQSVPAYVPNGKPAEARTLYNPDDPSTFPLRFPEPSLHDEYSCYWVDIFASPSTSESVYWCPRSLN